MIQQSVNSQKKRRKKREPADKATVEERLEIDMEQQTLKGVNQTTVMVKPILTTATLAAP